MRPLIGARRLHRWTAAVPAALLALSIAAASATAGVVLQPVSAHADSPAPVASFDWTMPDRSVDANHDGFIDSYFYSEDPAAHYTANRCCSVPPAQIDPPNWPINVDACASLPGSSGSPIQDYAFSLGGTLLSSGPNCQQVLTFPAQGSYTIDLTVTDDAGATATTSLPIVVKDLLVVSLGDSFASGEGNPPFEDTRCDRSTRAAPAQAAERLEQSSPRFSVTFIHLACSGAQILDSDPSDGAAGGGILDPYQGINPVRAPSGTIVPLNPQIDDMKALIGHRKIDFLMLGVGANDLGVVDILKSCIDLSYLVDPIAWLLIPDCYRHIPLLNTQSVDIFNHGIHTLPDHYRSLADALKALSSVDPTTGLLRPVLSPERIYISEYPDATRDQNGDYCDVFNSIGLPGFDQAEWRWASQTVLSTLDQTVAQAANSFGWNYVGGISSDFYSHGYCSTDHWLVRLAESLHDQGDENGTIHPNLAGHTDIADHLAFALLHDLAHPPNPPTITLSPILYPFFEFSQMGAAGWFIGECGLDGNCHHDQVIASLILEDGNGVAEPLSSSVAVTLDGDAVTIGPKPDYSCSLPSGSPNACIVQVLDHNSQGITTLVVTVEIRESGTHSLSMTAMNVRGRSVSKTFPVLVDLQPPILNPAVVQGLAGQNGWYRSPVDITFSASDHSPGSGLNRIDALLLGEGVNSSAAPLATTGDPTLGPVTAHVAAEGEHHISAEAVDNAELRSGETLDSGGNPIGPQTFVVKIDSRPPSIQGAADRPPDHNGWYRHDVTVHFTASDPTPGSGIDPSSVTPDLVLHEGRSQTAIGSASDLAGNSTTAGVGPISIDATPPAISITTPANGSYTLGQAVTVHYSCSDLLSGVDSCTGPVPDGGSLDTSSPGPKTFTVQATDLAGNAISRSVSYSVAYNVCALYDQTRAVRAGSTLPIKITLCDASGADVSSSSAVVTATGVVLISGTAPGSLEDGGNSNPDNNFRFDPGLGTAGGYVFNLSTKGFATGTYAMNFVAGSDPTTHSVRFQVR